MAVAAPDLLLAVEDLTTVCLTFGLTVVLTGDFAGLAFLATGCFARIGLRTGFIGLSERVDVIFTGLTDRAAAGRVTGLANVVCGVDWLLAGLLVDLGTSFLGEALAGVDEGLVIEGTGTANLLACFGFGEMILLLGLVALAVFGLVMARCSADDLDGRAASFLDD